MQDLSANMQCTDMKVKASSPCATKGWRWALFLTSLILLALALHYTNIAGSRLVIEYVEAIGKLYWLGVGFLLGATSYFGVASTNLVIITTGLKLDFVVKYTC